MMYPAPQSSAVVTALVPPKVLPTKEMNPPVDGCARENWASVLPSSAIAIPAAMIVSGAATPAVTTRKPNPKKKLSAGPIFAIVDAEISISPSAPRCSRSGDCGALVSENGTAAASLMSAPHLVLIPGARWTALSELSGAAPKRGRGAPVELNTDSALAPA